MLQYSVPSLAAKRLTNQTPNIMFWTIAVVDCLRNPDATLLCKPGFGGKGICHLQRDLIRGKVLYIPSP